MYVHTLLLATLLFSANILFAAEPSTLPKQCLGANQPVGVGQGIYPGRVVWSHADGAANWDGASGRWFDDRFNSQEDCDWMMREMLLSLTGCKNEKRAWDSLFVYFNRKHDKSDAGYRKGERITIKINQNNTSSHRDSEEINTSPQMLAALLRSLIREGGVPAKYITVTDPSRYVTDYLYNKIHGLFPQVVWVDNEGGEGRVKSTYVASSMKYSRDNGALASGIATPFTEADYLIDMALLKGHVGQGVTLCGKNWYGAMSIHADWRKNHHNNFSQNKQGKPQYLTFVDFMGHQSLGGKTLLWLIDGMYGCKLVNGKPGPKWSMAPFNGAWPSSLLGSLDPVAIDMVGNDFLINQFPDMRDADYSDMYLYEAALADHAPSGTKYDPDGNGKGLPSLGVAEHWNNAVDKQYSRNLGKSAGIELIYKHK